MSPSKRPPVPIATANRRIPEQGRIRLGIQVEGTSKAGRAYTRPASIKTLRFTSEDKGAIEAIANLYGGEVKAWKNGRLDEWEVISTSAEVPILLPPDPLGGTPVYELWDKGGLTRRCDGEIAVVPQRTPDGVDMAEVSCLCTAKGSMDCDPKVRLSVILKDVPFGGTWRLESKGWNVFHELPGMVEVIERLQSTGLVKAYLGVRAESKVIAGQTQDWVQPYLRLDESPDQIAAGAARFGSLGAATTPPPAALEAGGMVSDDDPCPCGVAHTRGEHGYSPDDEVAEGEIVDGEVDGPIVVAPEHAAALDAYLEQLDPGKYEELQARLHLGTHTARFDGEQLLVKRVPIS